MMHMKNKNKIIKRLSTVILSAVFIIISLFTSSALTANAEGEYTPIIGGDGNTYFYFKSQVSDSTGTIITALGYFCSFYNGSTGELIGTVFLSQADGNNCCYGSAYYVAGGDGIYIPMSAVQEKINGLSQDKKYDILKTQRNNCLKIVFDSVLTTAYRSNGVVYPCFYLRNVSGISSYLNMYNDLAKINQDVSGGSCSFLTYGSGFNYISYNSNYCYIGAASYIFDQRQAVCGVYPSFSRSLYYDIGSSTRTSGAEVGAKQNYIRAHFPSWQQISEGYFAVPAVSPSGSITVIEETPEIIEWSYSLPDGSDSSKYFKVWVTTKGTSSLSVPTWTDYNGQDDIIWYSAVHYADTGELQYWVLDVPYSEHNNEYGYYATHFYPYNSSGTQGEAKGDSYLPPSINIVFDGNGATSGSTESQSVSFGDSLTLNNNGFSKDVKFIFDGNGGTPEKDSETVSAEFLGWEDNNTFILNQLELPAYVFNAPFYANVHGDLLNAFGYDKLGLVSHWNNWIVNGTEERSSSPYFNLKYYMQHGGEDLINAYGNDALSFLCHWRDWGYKEGRTGMETVQPISSALYPNGATIKNISTVLGSTVTLKAYWEASVILPNAERTGYTLLGWNTEQDGSGTQYNVGDTVITDISTTFYAQWENDERYSLVVLPQNASYRENTDVITSFWAINNSDTDITPSNNLSMNFYVYSINGTLLKTAQKQLVIPKKDKNLMYFKWHLDEGQNGKDVIIKATVTDSNKTYAAAENSFSTIPYKLYTTPDTDYEEAAPAGFKVPLPPGSSLLQAKWWEWKYNDGAFEKVNYAIGNKIYTPAVSAPTSKSARIKKGKLVICSGYGFDCSFTSSALGVEGYTVPDEDSFTGQQYSYALFPEFSYGFGDGLSRNFENISGILKFWKTDEREDRHYTPLYFPDGKYIFNIVASDSWTPAGMITITANVEIGIDGNVYNDWYIGRK